MKASEQYFNRIFKQENFIHKHEAISYGELIRIEITMGESKDIIRYDYYKKEYEALKKQLGL